MLRRSGVFAFFVCYEVIVLPPPPRKPKGKPTVENYVRYLETHLVEKLKEQRYTSFEPINAGT